ncbi:CotH kinase family protein [Prevotella dentasini]|uniref:CotH kinase family protein n=1 Tax=Prevotella dentasini TaxID=589537 RepID=UPI0009FC04CD|nr:CotH kinase family protein [Prevotella dentasini]
MKLLTIRKILFGLLLSVFTVPAMGQNASIGTDSVLSLGLPVVLVTTVDAEEPSCEYVSHPEGCIGDGTKNATKVPGRVVVRQGNDVLFDSGDYLKKESGMTIKIRGNSSAYQDKKSFKIKLEKKGDMLSRGDDKTYKDKNWVLLKNDVLCLNTLIGMKTQELLHRGWTPAVRCVNVVINGDYRGVYMLGEAVERNEKCRIDVDKNNGYVIEEDPYWWNEDVSFAGGYLSDWYLDYFKYTFKYPDADELTPEQLSYIKTAVYNLEKSIEDGTYPDYMDVRSFASWLLAHDLLGDNDSAGSNMFLTKYDDTAESKFRMGPLWDFDAIMRMPDIWARIHDEYYFGRLFGSSNRTFAETYEALWNEITPTFFDEMTAFLQAYPQTEEGKAAERSRQADWDRWADSNFNPKGGTLAEDVVAAVNWFTARKAFLSSQIATLGVSTVSADKPLRSGEYYNLQGQRVSPTTKGLLIHNGRKVFNQ